MERTPLAEVLRLPRSYEDPCTPCCDFITHLFTPLKI